MERSCQKLQVVWSTHTFSHILKKLPLDSFYHCLIRQYSDCHFFSGKKIFWVRFIQLETLWMTIAETANSIEFSQKCKLTFHQSYWLEFFHEGLNGRFAIIRRFLVEIFAMFTPYIVSHTGRN